MRMRVEYAEKPLAIGTQVPRFAWEVPFEGRGRAQSAYRLRVASSAERLARGEADLWDSGKVESAQSVNVEYKGAALKSNMDCFWCVALWDESGEALFTSDVQQFGTALFKADDWQAAWIGMGPVDEPYSDPMLFQAGEVSEAVQAVEPDLRSPMMRKAFAVEQPVVRARAFAYGAGLFELRLNGRKVSDDLLSTPRTDYSKRALYSTYDITDQLRQGENVVGLILGNGWFNGQKRYWGWQQQWFGSPRGIVQLELELADGALQRIVTDGSWQGDWSPITFNSIYDGEHYDARLEQPGWDDAGFDASNWSAVNGVRSPGGALVPMTHESELVTETLRPLSVKQPKPGVFVYDVGKNITGWIRLKVKGGTAGDKIVLHFGEAQYEDGALNFSSNNAAQQQDEYILKGSGEESFEPRFTFHGFQFVEVTGYPGEPDPGCVEACFVRTAVEQTGTFECGSELINKIHRCTVQSQLCNVQMGVPTDDTQRPERLGWGADAWATGQEALYNLWMPRVYQKWIGDLRDQQAECGMVGMIAPQPGSEEDIVWSAAFFLIPWWQYQHCGDIRILEENYTSFKRYIAFLERVGCKTVETVTSGDMINRLLWRSGLENRFPAEGERGNLQITQWGDHLATAEGATTRAGIPLSVATAFYYLDVSLMVKVARVLGHEADAAYYEALGEKIKTAFNQRFHEPNLGFYDTGVQSAQAWPLAFGMIPEAHRDRVANYFINSVSEKQRRLTTGYVGTKYAIQALSMLGRDDVVWSLATAETYPGWGFMLRNNRTTSCEQWNGDRGSLNHAPLGAAIDEWFYWGLAGIRAVETEPGFEQIVFNPHIPDDLSFAEASIKTARGVVASAWTRAGNTVTLKITVPANCRATVCVPCDDAAEITESGLPCSEAEGVGSVSSDERETRLEIGSGVYVFSFERTG